MFLSVIRGILRGIFRDASRLTMTVFVLYLSHLAFNIFLDFEENDPNLGLIIRNFVD